MPDDLDERVIKGTERPTYMDQTESEESDEPADENIQDGDSDSGES